MGEATFHIQVGRLLCGRFRDMLEDEIFNGRKIRYRESSGLIERTFTVKGEYDDLKAVESRANHYKKCLEAG